ncbi:GNAT family N-acetyltransferase [Methylomonas sp. AM2-LC]|uniref:GNAT family N-acetyltransferase n=1 Tax=Methylomonas sp. AM2-LC TaxID=3153301 RepID=UPI0032660761
MLIRPYIAGEEEELRRVFLSSVHQCAIRYYRSDQIHAWAPDTYDFEDWYNRISMLNPFVAVIDGQIVGYADVQGSGYIDHFYVAGPFSGKGVGTALMRRIHEAALSQNVSRLYADVSLSAEAFFVINGFTVENRKTVIVRGVELQNTRMSKILFAKPQLL